VISLGGSLIVPEEINKHFLHKFKKILEKNYRDYKFIIVCGGGTIARKYIDSLLDEKLSKYALSKAGIMATRMNAQLIMQLFGKEANDKLPLNMKEVANNINKNKIVVCGALRFTKNATSDTTAAKLAGYLKTPFINMTNVKGLYTSDPRKNKNAKFIPRISWKAFEKEALKLKMTPGQHFVLDQKAATYIKKHKTKTYIIDSSLKNLENLLKSKKFIGTIIEN